MVATLNLCDIPPWVLASREFNDCPRPIRIQGDIAADHRFFRSLDAVTCPHRRAELFTDYITVKFYLDDAATETANARRAIKNSYVRFLRGWGGDSNSKEGAVLKGWVESRFGILPNFHKAPIHPAGQRDPESDYLPYDLDRMRGIEKTNSIYCQFDLLYAYCQYELQRSCEASEWLTLYRGTFDATEHQITERVDKRRYYVHLNNLLSFTSVMERAWEFGTTVWAVQVPKVKVFFHGELLPSVLLKGENEYLVIGGEYRVREVW